MTNQEFLNEILEYQKSRYLFFQKYQEIAKEIFVVFHDLCVKNNIPYYIACGSLLGAYRDNGVIPWDCDFDVYISYDSVEKLQRLLDEKLPSGYYYLSDLNNKDFAYYQIRICKSGYNDGVHVDVFYLIGMPNEKSKQQRLKKKINRLFSNRILKVEARANQKSTIKNYIKRIASVFVNQDINDKKMRRLCKLYPDPIKNAEYVAAVFREDAVFPACLFGVPQLFKAGKVEMLAPQDIEGYLTLYYGDWKSYYPIQDRYHEFDVLCNYLEKVEIEHIKIMNNGDGKL